MEIYLCFIYNFLLLTFLYILFPIVSSFQITENFSKLMILDPVQYTELIE